MGPQFKTEMEIVTGYRTLCWMESEIKDYYFVFNLLSCQYILFVRNRKIFVKVQQLQEVTRSVIRYMISFIPCLKKKFSENQKSLFQFFRYLS